MRYNNELYNLPFGDNPPKNYNRNSVRMISCAGEIKDTEEYSSHLCFHYKPSVPNK